MSTSVASTCAASGNMHGVDEEDNVLVVLTPKFAGNTIALPDPPHVDNGPAREAALLLLAHRQCAPLRRTENDFVHIAVTGVVELVNQYNSTYLDVALHFEMIQDWRSAHVEYVLATRYDIQIDCAWYKLAVIYLFGLNVVKIDEPLALDMTLLAIKLGSHAASSLYANYGLGHTYTTKHADHRAGIVTTTTDPEDYVKDRTDVYSGYHWNSSEMEMASLQAAATANDVRAQFELGSILSTTGTEGSAIWLLKACEQGHAHAQYEHATHLRHNSRLKKERDEARAFALQSQLQGYPEAEGFDDFHQSGALCAKLSFYSP